MGRGELGGGEQARATAARDGGNVPEGCEQGQLVPFPANNLTEPEISSTRLNKGPVASHGVQQ
jgi:hypothetical protein